MRAPHWPEENRHCQCGASFHSDAYLRDHCRVWLRGLREVTFKRRTTDKGEPYWISQTRTPMHTFTARPDVLAAGYVIRCQCGWQKIAELPLSGHSGDLNSPGRLAVAHIREVVEERLTRIEEAIRDDS